MALVTRGAAVSPVCAMTGRSLPARPARDRLRRAMADDPVLSERRDGVLVITINRPQARNAVNRAAAEGIAAALDELDGDDELRAGVITGAGGTFSAGMDLK